MKQRAALLLVVILAITTGVLSTVTTAPSLTGIDVSTTESSSPQPSPSPTSGSSPSPQPLNLNNGSTPTSTPSSINKKDDSSMAYDPIFLPMPVESLLNPQEVLLQEIRSLDEESTDKKIKNELIKAMKLNGKGKKVKSVTERSDLLKSLKDVAKPDPEKAALEELLEDEELNYNETDDIFIANDTDWTEDDEDDLDDEIDDEEDILFEQNCPSGCTCSEDYMAIATARCTKFSGEQNFRPEIAHLKIEKAADLDLGPHAFRAKGLNQLESVAIVDTRISSIDRTAFDGIPDLFSVNLTRNGLLALHPDIFQNNSQLNLLTLAGNPLQYTQAKGMPYAKYLLDAPSITELDLSNNALPRLLPTAFVRMPRLVYLSLRANKLRAIEKGLFSTLDQLEEVDLSHNLLNGLPIDLFDANEYLEILHISGNNLTTLATIKAPRLDSLDASKNRIKIIGKDDLAGFTEIEKLYLRSNGLKRIHQHAFADLVELSFLDLSLNKLTTLTEHHLRTNSRLEVLLMNDNPGLERLPVFKSQDSTFGIYRFECADCGLFDLEAGTFDAMPMLVHLNLARNRLTSFPKGLLGSLSSLKELDLSDNMFSKLDVDMFRGARTLTKLNLAGNPLSTLQVSPFLLTPNLARLDLSRCALDKIWSDAIVPLKSLRFLSVRGNRIERIYHEDLEATPKLSGLDISHNPLSCDHEFNAAIQWLTDHGVSPTETFRYLSNYAEDDELSEAEGLTQWTDLAKIICDSLEAGPPPRPLPHRPNTPTNKSPDLIPRTDLDDLARSFDHGQDETDEQLQNAWQLEEQEYEDFASVGERYRPWYAEVLWPMLIVIVVTLTVVLLVANFAVFLSKRRGRGPVIRTPMILRPGLIDNKNCGLVYKPLQEEIPTPHMPKRGSFYSSSTFHYDKIVPESV